MTHARGGVLRFPGARVALEVLPRVVIDEEWRYVCVNQAAVADLGRDDLVGRIVWAVFPGLCDSPLGRLLQRVMVTREPCVARQAAWQRPGFDVLTDIAPNPGGGIEVCYRVVKRVSARRRERA